MKNQDKQVFLSANTKLSKENEFAVFGGCKHMAIAENAGYFCVDSYKTDNGYFVGIECINNKDHKADFTLTMLATAQNCSPNFVASLISHPANSSIKKPTYAQLEAERDKLLDELKSLKTEKSE